ncbi:MAG TPA: L-serine ammonia-lyase, iron-sulfur-dependent, subunit alpha [Clostridia bacterium]|nr:L-serine ammonia-lyase, iron-sulfur-dependent, subunit alpha [Clostridia bacterium]
MTKDDAVLLDILKREIVPATGCTEPVAVAYSTAVARQKLSGKVIKVVITVDPGLFKNGMRVGIPGIKERGLEMAGALGLTAGDPGKALRVIEDISLEQLEEAKELISSGKIHVQVREDYPRLYVETLLQTEKGEVRIITMDRHLNVVSTDGGQQPFSCGLQDAASGCGAQAIQSYTLEDFIRFSEKIPLEEISFLEQGVALNLALAREGLTLPGGIGGKLKQLVADGMMSEDMMYNAKLLCSAASEARMSGSKLAAMSSAGSGNHGITIFMTVFAIAEKTGASREKLLRALALSNLITFYIKSYTGTLSAMCGCGVAAGIGASVGVTYLLGGTSQDMLGTMINMVGTIAGLICDGGKEGCAYKLALSAGWAVQSALLAVSGAIINTTDGILASDFEKIIKNMGYVCNPGMVGTNRAIIQVMSGI